ncbi:MAG: hypothetical protein ACE5JL_13220 [Dehalococcoidia bacterium]
MTLQRFVERRVPSQLREAFEEMMSTAAGWLRLAVIGKERLQDTPALINSLAHEAAIIPSTFMNPAISVYQVRGLRGLIELVKQAWALLRAA